MRAGNLLKIKRKQAQYTQMKLAIKAGVSLPTIQNIEMDKANPTVHLLEKICAPLNLSVELISNEPDWVLLEQCGLPISVEERSLVSLVKEKPSPQNLAHHLLLAIEYIEKQKDPRWKEAVSALLWAIHHHYYNYYLYCLDNPKTDKFLKNHPLSGRIIKLMRIASSKLSKII